MLLCRRAAANLQVDTVPYQGRHSRASVERAESLRTLESVQETRVMEISQVCAPLREKRTCQSKLVRVRSIGPGTLRALQQPPALGIASWSRLSDTASIAQSFVIDLFCANTDLQQFFLNGGVQCAKLEPFSDDNTIFRREFKRFCASWHVVPGRDALATSIFALSCPKSPTCAKCDSTLGIARFLNGLTNVK